MSVVRNDNSEEKAAKATNGKKGTQQAKASARTAD